MEIKFDSFFFCSTISSDWIKAEKELNGFVIADHEFLGVKLKTSVIAIKNLKSTNIKFRILNKIEYEPFMEESERRVADIVQVFPKEFLFDPSAELVLNLPSCVASKSCGQLVCLYCCNALVRHGVKQLKWKPLDSFSFHVNESRTEAKIICKKSGLYTIKVTQHPQVTKNLDIYTECEVSLKKFPGIKIKFPGGCVARKTPVTLEAISNEDLYTVPTPLPASPRSLGSWRPPQCCKLEDLDSTDMVDITSSPVVLIRPSRLRFTRPVQLTLPLLGEDFEDFFSRGNTRIAVLQSKVLDEETVLWKHHYSTPEVSVLLSV